MATFIKDNSSKENGMEEVKYYFQMQQLMKVFGLKILSND
jgi:hypothetical protein